MCFTAGEAKPLQYWDVNILLFLPITSPPAAREQLRPRSTHVHTHLTVCEHTGRYWNSLLYHIQPRFNLPATSGALSFPLLSVSCMKQTFNWNNLLQNNKRKSTHKHLCSLCPLLTETREHKTGRMLRFHHQPGDSRIRVSSDTLVLHNTNFLTAFIRKAGSACEQEWPSFRWLMNLSLSITLLTTYWPLPQATCQSAPEWSATSSTVFNTLKRSEMGK